MLAVINIFHSIYKIKNFSYMKLQNKMSGSLIISLLFALCLTFFSFDSQGSYKNYSYTLLRVLSENGKIKDGDLPDWFLLDPEKDGYEGVRTNAFYKYLSTLSFVPERKDVIVAVIDSGFDIDHPDLKDNIWSNEKEINGAAGIDDDDNGFTDDFHGWNFLGDTHEIPYEVTREYYRLKKLNTSPTDAYFIKVQEEFENKKDDVFSSQSGISETLNEYIKAENTLREKNISSDPQKLMEISDELKGKYQDAASIILGIYMLYGTDKNDLIELNDKFNTKARVLFDSSEYVISGENKELLLEINYGNNDVTEKTEEHGTHVSGIIGSKKTGQAHFVKIMCLRAVPNEGDERDKDIGNAIRYAVDNGADIINMSAGKYFSPNPEFVAEAVKYAEDKGVLFVVSAGNDGKDITNIVNYPVKYEITDGEKKYFTNMIVVGASSWMKQWSETKDPDNMNSKYDLAASFTNYSDSVVDIFAPGVQINSTVPNDSYKRLSGTSMASPVVAGIAAVIKSYFPQLTAAQLKDVILSSVRMYDGLRVKVKGKSSKIPFSELSKTGGVIDLINAYKKANELYGSGN